MAKYGWKWSSSNRGCSHNKEELRKSCPNVFAVSSSRNVPSGQERGERMFSQASRNSKCTFCMTIKSSSSFDQSTAITRNFIICLIPEIPRDIVCKTLWLFVRRTLSAGPKDVRLKRELTKLYIFLQSVLIKNCFSFFGDHYFFGDHSWTQSAVLRKGRPL